LVQGQKVQQGIGAVLPDDNDSLFPGKRYREFDPDRQDRLAQRIAMKLTMPGVNDMLREKWLDLEEGGRGPCAEGQRQLQDHDVSVAVAVGALPEGA
jgi:hypothetical protein